MGVNKNYLNQVSNPTGKVTFMQSIKDRVGFVVERTSAAAAIKQIVAAEEAGIRQIWMNQAYLDTLTIFAAAATKTSEVRLGTAIVQTYPRHPLALAQQVLVLNDIAPGRLRLGIGPSHSSIIEGIFGLPQRKPLVHLREYVEVLRAILWEGKVNHHGEFFNVVVTPGWASYIAKYGAASNIGFCTRREGLPIGWGNRRRSSFMVMPCSISAQYRTAGVTERSIYRRTISLFSSISSTCSSSAY
jgi:hypothetical protein